MVLRSMAPRKSRGRPLPLGQADPEYLYSVAEAAELLHLSQWKIRNLVTRGRLIAIVFDHTHRIRAKDLKAFIVEHRREG